MTEGLDAGRVEVCDGLELRSALVAGTAWLERNVEIVNALNVFPVPDGDTGSNMWLTLQSAVGETAELGQGGAGAVAHAASHGALMGARGNSGVILSQLLRGIARSLDSKESFRATDLADALAEGAATAYKGVIKPVEGTILTVARESADAAVAAARSGADLVGTLAAAVAVGRESLARTPQLLPVLAEAGVVDAGGQGYLHFLEGMLRHFSGEHTPIDSPIIAAAQPLNVTESYYGYCTEFIVQGENLDISALRTAVSAQGDSALVVGDQHLVRVHVHTFDPGTVLSLALEHGSLHKIKIDNMQDQHREFLKSGQLELVPIQARPDAVNAPAKDTTAIVAVAAGGGLTEVLRSLGATSVVPGGQTMNPSTGELLQAVEASSAEEVILLPNNSNIVLTARQVLALSRKRLVVVPTQTVPQGIAALMAFNYESDLDTNLVAMTAAAEGVRTIEITRAVRSVKFNGKTVEEGSAIALLDGRLISSGEDFVGVVVAALTEAGADDAELITIYHGDGVSRDEANNLASEIGGHWPDQVIEVVDGGQPHYPFIISVE